MTTPCPICGAPYGFHDDAPHAEACEQIPAHLKRISNTAMRREARKLLVLNTLEETQP